MTDDTAQAVAPGVAKIQGLTQAGFSTDEINQYRDQVSGQMNAAGFHQEEINNYWGVKTPDPSGVQDIAAQTKPTPGAMAPNNEAMRGELMGSYERGETKNPLEFLHSTLSAITPVVATLLNSNKHPIDTAQAAGSAAIDTMEQGTEGAIKAGANLETSVAAPVMNPDTLKKLQAAGLYTPGESPVHEYSSAVFGGLFAPVSKAMDAATSFGESPTTPQNKGIRENSGNLFSTVMDVLGVAGLGGHGKAAEAAPTEAPNLTTETAGPWGQAPKAQDFPNAAIVTNGEHAEPEVSAVLRAIYAEKGISPSQVIADSKENPTIPQDLAAGVMPRAYMTGDDLPKVDLPEMGKKAEASYPFVEGQSEAPQLSEEEAHKLGQEGSEAPKLGDALDQKLQTAFGSHLEPVMKHLIDEHGVDNTHAELERYMGIMDSHADLKPTSDINTPERVTMRKDIEDKIYQQKGFFDPKEAPAGEIKKDKVADIVLGPPAVGKSSVVAEPLARAHDSRLIDVDEVKKAIPEYDNGAGAQAVHDESGIISTDILKRAINSGENVVIPKVGHTQAGVELLIDTLKQKGYTVNVHLVHAPDTVTIPRAMDRFIKENRAVPVPYLRSIGDRPMQTYEALKGKADGYSYTDSSGKSPRLVEEATGNRQADSEGPGIIEGLLRSRRDYGSAHDENAQGDAGGNGSREEADAGRLATPVAKEEIPQTKGSTVEMLKPPDLTLDPKRFQYKASNEHGETSALAGVTKFEPALSGIVTAWRAEDGKTYVINGHQRTNLAKRAEAAGQTGIEMPARVYKESDGYTPEFMKVMGAYQNIAEGSGTAIDAAKILRGKDIIPKDYQLPELPPKSQLVQQGHGLAALGDDAFGMVVNKVVPEAYAAEVGRSLEDPKQQLAAMGELVKHEPANIEQARHMVNDIKNSGFSEGDQQALFGTEHNTFSLFGERSKILDNTIKQLRKLKSAFGTAVKQEGALSEAGNVLSTDANVKARTANEALIARLEADATRKGPISDALSDAARQLKAGGSVAAITKSFIARASEIDARGPEGSVQRSDIGGGYKPPLPGQKPRYLKQSELAGTERISDRALAERKMAEPMRGQKGQENPNDGLFDVAGRGQRDILRDFRADQAGSVNIPGDKPDIPRSDAEKEVLQKIGPSAEPRRKPLSWEKFYTAVVDRLEPINSIMKKLSGDEKLPITQDTYKLFRNLAGNYGRAQNFIEGHAFDFKTYKDTGPGLANILEPVKEDLDGLRAYMASRRAIELEARDIEPGIPIGAAKKVIAEGAEKYEPIFKQLTEYQSGLLNYLKDAGVFTQDAVDAMRGANASYAPFYRLLADADVGLAKGNGIRNPIKTIEGSELGIIDPIESIVRNTYAYIDIAERNAAAKSFYDLASKSEQPDEYFTKPEPVLKSTTVTENEMNGFLKAQGIEGTPESLLTVFRAMRTPLAPDQIGFFDKGKWTVLKVDPDLAEAFAGTDKAQHGMLFKMLAVPARMLRYGLVSPEFILRHLERNTLSATVIGEKAKVPFENLYKGMFSYLNKDSWYEGWLKSGGKVSALSGLTRDDIQDQMHRISAEEPAANFLGKAWNIVKTPFDLIHGLQQGLENINRLGAYKQAMSGLDVNKESILDAGYYSRNVAPDPSRIGSKTGTWNAITALANTEIQHTAQLVDAFKTRPLPTLAKAFAFITLPTIINWAYNQGTDQWKEAKAWERDAFWLHPANGFTFRLPKPFFMGFLFGSVPERLLDLASGNDKDGKGIIDGIKDMVEQASPNTIPTGITPILEQLTNHSMFRGTQLVPDHLMQQLPEYRYSEYTSELTKAAGKLVGYVPFVKNTSMASPVVIDNYLRAWGGSLGTYVLQGADAALRKAGVLPDPMLPTRTLADIPFVKAFVVRYPDAQAESIQRFQDSYQHMSQVTNTFKALIKQGEVAQASSLMQSNPQAFYKLDNINKTINEQNQLVRMIYKNPGIKPDEKRQLIDATYFQMIQISSAGNNIIKTMDASPTVH